MTPPPPTETSGTAPARRWPGLARLLLRLRRDASGTAAVEFALASIPFFACLFAVFSLALMFFVDAALDASVQKAARLIRTGQAQTNSLSQASFKSQICTGMLNIFDCSSKLYVTVSVVSDVASVTYLDPKSSGTIPTSSSYDIGNAGDYVLVQAFLPWSSMVGLFASYAPLSDGSYVLGSSALFRNEPFTGS